MGKISSKTLDNLNSSVREIVEKAFNEIYNEYSYLVYYVSLKIIKDSSEAQAITNEVFYRFFANKDKIDSSKSIKYFLITICKNLSIDYLKNINNVEELKDNQSYTLEYSNDFNSYIEQFKSFLDEEEIEIIVLHFLYDFSFKEIAKQSNKSINAISSKYRRILAKIKQNYSRR